MIRTHHGARPAALARAALTVAVCTLGPVRSAYAQGTVIVDLGALAGHFETEARAINDTGTLAGFSVGPFPAADAVVLNGTVQTLSGLAGIRSFAFDVSAAGHVAGQAALTPGSLTPHAMVWTPATGPIQLSSVFSQARALTGSGFAVGHGAGRAWRWEYLTGAALDLGDLGGGSADAFDIGAWGRTLGHVVGFSTNALNVRRAFLWTPQNGMVDLGALGGLAPRFPSEARAIGPDGKIVGFSGSSAFLYENGGMRRLKGIDGGDFSIAEDVNAKGFIVGTATDASGGPRAVVWYKGRLHDLNVFVTAQSGWDLLQNAMGTNANGDVVGIGYLLGRKRGFMIPSVPDRL